MPHETPHETELLRPLRAKLDKVYGIVQSLLASGSGITQLTGDVTAGPGTGSQAATIASAAVTYAKMQAVSAASKLLGRGAGGTAAVREITLGSNLSMSGDTLNVTGLGSGAAGNASTTTAVGSEPGSPVSGDLDFYNNGFVVSRYSGSAWVPWGPLFPFADPNLQTWAWVNQGGATVSSTNGGVYLFGPKAASNSWRIRKKTAPSTPYKIDIAFLGAYALAQQQYCSLLFRESSSGKLHIFTLACVSTTSVALISTKWTNETTFSADYKIVTGVPWGARGLQFLRIEDNGTNRICSYSADGQNWLQFHSVGRTDFLTADEVGFGVSDSSNAYDIGMTVLSWKES